MSMHGDVFVTTHAVDQFRARVRPVPYDHARALLLADLRAPIAWKVMPSYQGRPCLLLAIDDDRQYIAAVRENDCQTPPWALVTVMPTCRPGPKRYPRWLEPGWRFFRPGDSWRDLDITIASDWDAEYARERRGA